MYKVLIADDEKIIRMGLMQIIDWEGMGFTIAGQAANGSEALSFIEKENPDVVLIDIRMPKLHGLDAIKTARERGFTGKVIVLSGFSDFEYAQTAISYGVMAYLTKPVDREKLIGVLEKAKSEMDTEREEKEIHDSFLGKTRKTLLRGLLLDELSLGESEIRELGLTHSMYQVIFYENYSRGTENCYPLADILRVANPDERELETISIDGHEVILLKGHHPVNKLKTILEHFENDIPPEKNSPLDSVFIACGSVVKNAEEIARSYREALMLMEHRFFAARNQHTMVYAEEEFTARGNDEAGENEDRDGDTSAASQVSFIDSYAEELTNQIQAFNRKQIAETLHQMEKELAQSPMSVEEQKRELMDLWFSIRERLVRIYNQTEIPFPQNAETIVFFKDCDYLYEVVLFFTEQFDKIMSALGYSSRDNIIDDVIAYIDHNYKTNITLETIAPLFGYNSSYLGKIFSKKLGQNFNTYLDTLRVEKAKEILTTTKAPVYKVAEMVGYKNVDYFHIKFKKYTGSSPAEYRKLSE